MQVKKFEAPTMQEALKVIKRELGPEAIILSTKHIKSGFGLMSKASVEVTAAIAEKDLKKKKMAEKGLPQEVKEKIWNSKAEKQSEIYDTYFEKQLKRASKDRVEIGAARGRDDREERREQTRQEQPRQQARQPQAPMSRQELARQPQPKIDTARWEITQPAPRMDARAAVNAAAAASAPGSSVASAVSTAPAPRERRYIDISDDESSGPSSSQPTYGVSASASSNEKVKTLEKDIEQLKSMIGELASGSSGITSHSREEGDQDLTPELVRAMQDLAAGGVEKKFARQIVRQASFDLSSMERHEEQAIMDRVAYHLVSDIQVKDILEGVGAKAGSARSTVIALVGPTGVGKTTTIAKIASLGILERRLRVGLINLDSYKVAAADQLATYAKIMNIPFRSVTTKEELSQAIYDFSSLDLVLVDTTGRSQKDQESLLQLRHLLATVENCQSVLMVSATTKDSDMNEVVSRFKIFQPAGLVFSKLDETSVYGCIYNVQKRSGLPLLYFTVGQRVPEDIEKASAERVADLVLDL
jgi:flagellar biosynthesis protein FlhF